MTEDRHEKLLREDWSDSWDELPEAPPLVPGPKTAQITLRLSPGLVERVRRVAELGSLPYHALARSWLIEAIQHHEPAAAQPDGGPHTAQLNIKLDRQAVDALKARADQLRRPYHRLAREWIAAAVSREEERLGLEPLDGEHPPAGAPSRHAVSPYATGGGGVTFERRVAALYLAMLLTGDTAAELGGDREIRSVAFQQAPRVPVDDLVILGARPEEPEPTLELAVGVRRKPNIVKGDTKTQALIVECLRALLMAPGDGPERRLALLVAGTQTHAKQLAELAGLAAIQMGPSQFFSLVKTSNKFDKQLRTRLSHVEALVGNALPELGVADADDRTVARHVWQLLRRLVVVMPRLEEPDTRDWDGTRRHLRRVARGETVVAARQLLDRLESLAGQYGSSAATVDRTLLRRDVHSLLDTARSRTTPAWELLDGLQRQARIAVRDHVSTGGSDQLHLDRRSECAAIMAAARAAGALIVTGDSGVGKSALVLEAVAGAEAASNGEVQAVFLNLRELPERSFELVARLGCPLDRTLSDLSAPDRYLVVDAADAATEGHEQVFSALVDAASNSGLRLIAVTSSDAREVTRDLITAQVTEAEVAEHVVEVLNDAQLQQLAQKFPKLERLAADPRSRELLRRLVVVDLLLRSDVSESPLTDADAMRQIWEGLVRRHGRRDHGIPDAREQVMLGLALRELGRGSTSEAAAMLDWAAVDGLRRGGLLRSSPDNPWQVVPDFAHDEIRRYAVARALLSDGDPAAALLGAGAPRWALSAGRLACQAILDQPDRPDAPVRRRLSRLQQAFDRLVEEGHGARWADLPSEALLTLANPVPVLTDAWPDLCADDAAGFQRLLRLIDQRHRDASGIVDPIIVEPVIALMLDGSAPYQVPKESWALRDWLLALVVRDTPSDHSLRKRLRDRLVAACAAADKALVAEQEAAAAALAARTPEQIERERKHAERHRQLFSEIGYPRRRRRKRPELPQTLTDETVLELFGLLGPDLGEDGEQLLRRVGRDAPSRLAPAVEQLGAGRALASYRRGLLADLVEAYYLDEDADGSQFHDRYGIRDHRWRGVGVPLSALYRGPFAALFQSDFRLGVSVLNRLLNHAARARARTMADLDDPWRPTSGDAIAAYSVELWITGEPRTYVGDDHVWRWYRGTGVGPYPCMSALQALERYCDHLLAAEIPPNRLVPILLDGCENLAMPGLVAGLLMRHIERAGSLLDPFFAEPMAWHLEFVRVTSESTGLAASSEGLAHPERRLWSLREAAMWLTIQADSERADALRAVGEQLVARALELSQESAQQAEGGHPEERGDDVTVVRGWASALDRTTYSAQAEGDKVVFESSPPEDVQAALEPDNEDLRRGSEALHIQMRYFRAADPRRADAPPPTQDELAQDLDVAQELVAHPPTRSAVGIPETAAAIAAYALRAMLAGEVEADEEGRKFVVEVILEVAEGVAPPDPSEFEGSFFEMGGDRVAARSLPLLLLPTAAPLRALAASELDEGDERVLVAGRRLAQATAMETRLFLARGLDAVWSTPCQTGNECHHKRGLDLAIESMRDCVLGEWSGSRREIESLSGPVAETLAAVPDEDIFVTKLDAAIRALGVAAISETCVSTEVEPLLTELLLAQRRGLLAHEENFDQRGSHALVAARALLALAGAGDEQPLRQHIAAYADRSNYLSSLLRALAAAAEETTEAAQTARQLWPSIIEQVLELNSSGHQPFSDRYYGDWTLAALAPTPTADFEFLYWEAGKEPIAWRDPLGWQDVFDVWVPVASGDPRCIDSFIRLVRELPVEQQISFGLPRVARLVEGDVKAASTRSFLLAEWLKELRATTVDSESQAAWQRLVDALVVLGNRTLAPYSE